MEELYKVMDDLLEVEFQMKAVMDSSYSQPEYSRGGARLFLSGRSGLDYNDSKGVLPWAAMPLTAGNDRKKAAALISQNRHQ